MNWTWFVAIGCLLLVVAFFGVCMMAAIGTPKPDKSSGLTRKTLKKDLRDGP